MLVEKFVLRRILIKALINPDVEIRLGKVLINSFSGLMEKTQRKEVYAKNIALRFRVRGGYGET